MKEKIVIALFVCFLLLFWTEMSVWAISDPLPKANNKVGVHILDPNEIDRVADLTNSNGGDWGYVTVPLRADDRDRIKWQKFFESVKQNHLIPIIRLATTMQSYGWERPTLFDAVDFANFLSDLVWPVKNRYIVVYNEPNHASEWGGIVDPVDYGRILQYTTEVFKQKNDNFYILPAGLDAAAPNDKNHQNLYNFIYQMNSAYPQALQNIDGWNSHSYPNPGFSGSPMNNHSQSIVSFKYETGLIKNLTGKDLPIFITETGWRNRALSDETVGEFYRQAFENVWNDQSIVAVTPFILLAGDGPFESFSLLDPGGQEKPQYLAIKNLEKINGNPEKEIQAIASTEILGASEVKTENVEVQPLKDPFEWGKKNWKRLFKWLMVK